MFRTECCSGTFIDFATVGKPLGGVQPARPTAELLRVQKRNWLPLVMFIPQNHHPIHLVFWINGNNSNIYMIRLAPFTDRRVVATLKRRRFYKRRRRDLLLNTGAPLSTLPLELWPKFCFPPTVERASSIAKRAVHAVLQMRRLFLVTTGAFDQRHLGGVRVIRDARVAILAAQNSVNAGRMFGGIQRTLLPLAEVVPA